MILLGTFGVVAAVAITVYGWKSIGGGPQVHFLLEIERGSAVVHHLDAVEARLVYALREAGADCAVWSAPDAVIEIPCRPMKSAGAGDALKGVVPGWEISRVASGHWRARMPGEIRATIEARAVDATTEALRDVLARVGRSVTIEREGPGRLHVALTSLIDVDYLTQMIADPIVFKFMEVAYPPGGRASNWVPPDSEEAALALFGGELPDGTMLVAQHFERPDGSYLPLYWPLKRAAVVVGDDLVSAYRTRDEWNDPAISFELSEEAGRRLGSASTANIGRHMAIVIAGRESQEIVAAPVIEDTIRESGIIRGGFTSQTADELAAKLRFGRLPIRYRLLSSWTDEGPAPDGASKTPAKAPLTSVAAGAHLGTAALG